MWRIWTISLRAFLPAALSRTGLVPSRILHVLKAALRTRPCFWAHQAIDGTEAWSTSSSHFNWPKHQLSQKHRRSDTNSLTSLAPRTRWQTGRMGLEQGRKCCWRWHPSSKALHHCQSKMCPKINPDPEEKKRLALSSFSPLTLKVDVTADVLAPRRKSFQHQHPLPGGSRWREVSRLLLLASN